MEFIKQVIAEREEEKDWGQYKNEKYELPGSFLREGSNYHRVVSSRMRTQYKTYKPTHIIFFPNQNNAIHDINNGSRRLY
jgi:hypothetical protein